MSTKDSSGVLKRILDNTRLGDPQIGKRVGAHRGTVNKWRSGRLPNNEHLSKLLGLFNEAGTPEEWSTLFEQRNLPVPDLSYRTQCTHSHTSKYVGPVWTIVEPREETRNALHQYTIQWLNPAHPSGGVEVSGYLDFSDGQRKTLLYHKWNNVESFPLRFSVWPSCKVTFGHGDPESREVIDLSKEKWNPIDSNEGDKAIIALTLPFPKEFRERFPFRAGDVLYIIVGEEDKANLPIRITMQDHVLILDLSQLFMGAIGSGNSSAP